MIEITTDLTVCQEEILSDKRSNGEERPWKTHKEDSQLLSQVFWKLGFWGKALRVRSCGDLLKFAVEDGRKRLVYASFCRERLCPTCQWRRSLRIGNDVRQVADYLTEKQGLKYIVLALTVRNCSADNLGKTIDELIQAWNRFVGYSEIKRAAVGWFRTFEVTHNLDKIGTDSEYHPHFHALIAVKQSYFDGRDYITHSRYKELWQRAARLDYEPWVHIQAVKGDNLSKAVLEVSKYSTKSSEVIIRDDWQLTVETVRLLNEVFRKRRFVAWGGAMKLAKQELDLLDEDDADLVHIENDGVSEQAPIEYYAWFSNYRQYFRVGKDRRD